MKQDGVIRLRGRPLGQGTPSVPSPSDMYHNTHLSPFRMCSFEAMCNFPAYFAAPCTPVWLLRRNQLRFRSPARWTSRCVHALKGHVSILLITQAEEADERRRCIGTHITVTFRIEDGRAEVAHKKIINYYFNFKNALVVLCSCSWMIRLTKYLEWSLYGD